MHTVISESAGQSTVHVIVLVWRDEIVFREGDHFSSREKTLVNRGPSTHRRPDTCKNDPEYWLSNCMKLLLLVGIMLGEPPSHRNLLLFKVSRSASLGKKNRLDAAFQQFIALSAIKPSELPVPSSSSGRFAKPTVPANYSPGARQ
jgi:hypothetical protein